MWSLFLFFLGNFQRLDGSLETEGIELSFLVNDELSYLVRPFTLKCELEMISSPHSLTQTLPRYDGTFPFRLTKDE